MAHVILPSNSGGAESLGGEEGEEAFIVFFARSGDELVLVFAPMLHFVEGILHTEGDDFLGIGATAGESSAEFVFIGGHDEEVDEGVLDGGVVAGADLGSALDIDVHDDVLPAFDEGMDLGAKGAVEVAVDFGVFEKLAGGDVCFELFAGEEVVIASVGFALAGGAGGAGDRIVGGAGLGEAAAEGGLSGARGAGDEEKDAGAALHARDAPGKWGRWQEWGAGLGRIRG